MTPIDIGFSVADSKSLASRSGEGDFIFYGGSTKSNTTLFIVLGVVAVLGFGTWLLLRGGR